MSLRLVRVRLYPLYSSHHPENKLPFFFFFWFFDFSEDTIDGGLYNVRKMVSLKYLEERRTALVKAAKRLLLLNGELVLEDWTTLSAIEEAKVIKAREVV
jgi:hypothetical protein